MIEKRAICRATRPTVAIPRALIGDPRNDENVIVAQLHATMLRFHNRLADVLKEAGEPHTFDDVQRVVLHPGRSVAGFYQQ